MCTGGITGPWLADHDASDPAHGIVCTRVDNLTSDLRLAYYIFRTLKFLISL